MWGNGWQPVLSVVEGPAAIGIRSYPVKVAGYELKVNIGEEDEKKET